MTRTKNFFYRLLVLIFLFKKTVFCAILNDVNNNLHYGFHNNNNNNNNNNNDVKEEQIHLNFKQNSVDENPFNQELNDRLYKPQNQNVYQNQDDRANDVISHFDQHLHQNLLYSSFNQNKNNNNYYKYRQNKHQNKPIQQKHIDFHYQKNIGDNRQNEMNPVFVDPVTTKPQIKPVNVGKNIKVIYIPGSFSSKNELVDFLLQILQPNEANPDGVQFVKTTRFLLNSSPTSGVFAHGEVKENGKRKYFYLTGSELLNIFNNEKAYETKETNTNNNNNINNNNFMNNPSDNLHHLHKVSSFFKRDGRQKLDSEHVNRKDYKLNPSDDLVQQENELKKEETVDSE